MALKDDNFFYKQTASSRIKASIVAEYFPRYCNIINKIPQKEIRYLDLFSGPGMYDDGNFSTPLLIAKACAEDPKLTQIVHLFFNDNKYSDQLKSNFDKHFPSGTFSFTPRFANKTVGESEQIYKYLTRESTLTKNPYPTLLFFDPWGYKGIDTLALAKFLEHWGNEIFLFVNIKRIHAAIENDKFDELMQLLFPSTISRIRRDRRYEAVSVYDRLNLIMSNLAMEFKSAVKDKLYHCAFKFQEEDSNATSHYIIHFTKHPKGFELVKQIYYDFDNIGANLERDNTYTFDAKMMDSKQNSLFVFGDLNIASLSKKLEIEYKGKTLTAKQLFDEHNVQTKFCGSHYAKTLRDMVEKGKVKATFTDNVNHKVSVLLTDTCKIEFI